MLVEESRSMEGGHRPDVGSTGFESAHHLEENHERRKRIDTLGGRGDVPARVKVGIEGGIDRVEHPLGNRPERFLESRCCDSFGRETEVSWPDARKVTPGAEPSSGTITQYFLGGALERSSIRISPEPFLGVVAEPPIRDGRIVRERGTFRCGRH
ncbi:hypothetical protein [Natrarchaeobaculum aegyptiacum]|uniref:hypothetical protein n=1 Tax=Natrarchaeobaculum aegyptiacum TaxID=745377 RepID=UPI001E4A4690|nr:hypothetical protein [Natrarchaeobaculum aegyptiacum]